MQAQYTNMLKLEGYYLLQANEAGREGFLSYERTFAKSVFRGVYQGLFIGIGRIVVTVSIAIIGFGILGIPGVFLISIPQGILCSVLMYYFLLRGRLQLDSDNAVVFHLEHIEGTDGMQFVLSTTLSHSEKTRKYIGGDKVRQTHVAMKAKKAPHYSSTDPKVFIQIMTDKESGWLRSRKLLNRVHVSKEKATSWTLVRQAGLNEQLELV